MKRLAIFVHWERDGHIYEYVLYYLKSLQTIAKDVIMVANGGVASGESSKLDEIGVRLLERENDGFDFGAWKTSLNLIGRETIEQYDELVLCNNSCYGPVIPFDEVFGKMEKQDCDFWGLYRHPQTAEFKSHLQSYFLVIRNSILKSDHFWRYWEALKIPHSWEDAVNFETNFTFYFENVGFKSTSYVPVSTLNEFVENPTLIFANDLIRDYRFPLVKKKLFSEDYLYFIYHSRASQAQETISFLQKNSEYPTDYIIKHIIRTLPLTTICRALHLNYSLQQHSRLSSSSAKGSVAIVVHSYYEDLIDEAISYLRNVPSRAFIFIVVVSERMKTLWEQKVSTLNNKGIEIRLQQNRGRNESAYWITCRDVIEKFDYICLVHDKKSPHDVALQGLEFSRYCWGACLFNHNYIENTLSLFEENPHLGILMPPTPNFMRFIEYIYGKEWGGNKITAKFLYKRLLMQVPFDEKECVAPYGAMFWLRGKAFAPFYRYNWTFEDFPEEPIKTSDGTILHALERMYPMIAQEAGYLSAYILPTSMSAVYNDNNSYIVREIALMRKTLYNNIEELKGLKETVTVLKEIITGKEERIHHIERHKRRYKKIAAILLILLVIAMVFVLKLSLFA